LHKEYQARFTRDANATIDEFKKTRDELQKRYAELHQVDAASSSSLQKEMASLQSQHDKLYAEIVAQVQREVRVVAQEKGITTVLSDVAGNGKGVDLTDAAKKEIESLHE
jgi:Skp family chaperone for outer membrane proteins